MEETDMAVVVSSEQNEVAKFKKLKLNIEKHRRRMVKEDLAAKFKDADNPFRLAFVCAMWMTGFDVPSLSTIYLDKPMKNHTLMQTIARANRVYGEKTSALIVDYVNIFRNLQKALAIYGTGSGGGVNPGDTPIKPKSELVKELAKVIAETEEFCREKGIDVDLIIQADKLLKIALISDAVEAILVNDESKKRFLSLTAVVKNLFKAILPDADANKYYEKYALFNTLADKIRSETGAVDISEVLVKVQQLLDESIAAEGFLVREPKKSKLLDLSKINFEALRKKFDRARKHTQIAEMRAAIEAKLHAMLRLNRTRTDYVDRFQRLIDEYNSGAINIEMFYEQLLAFIKALSEEDQRGIVEGLSEEELALFDLLKKPKLAKKEMEQVKLASKKLLDILKREKLVLDWRKRQQTRADVQYTIETMLDEMLPKTYTPDVYKEKCTVAYQHVYDSYYGAGKSVYAEAA
ncbi:MAG TPA: type I restriction enzyme endonuclease domain-containing protein [Anaerolineales bacterium]|nr:type I restriction enzyme endonuclease domain-containing protein [Candidatus Hodarchaeales archaeon]HLA88584.1 type I restriction enzyme endonuclease domain-containing protein [Anaerolineales bacterium]